MNKKKVEMKSYRKYLASLERKIDDNDNKYTRIPKKILIDPILSSKEKLTWMILASFLYTSENRIFPSRIRLAMLLGINNVQQVSRLTKTLKDKGYLSKQCIGLNRVAYELYFHPSVNEKAFYNEINEFGILVPSYYEELAMESGKRMKNSLV